MIADYIGADIVKNEITAQATAAAFIDPDVDTIFEIGGQDSKYISLRNGVIVDFEMNKACAAGTGSFLEEQAEKMDISVKNEFQKAALRAGNPCRLGERCTVFMENSLMANLQRGEGKEDLLAGLAYSIVQNYINRVVCNRTVGNKIFFQGGVAFNKSVVAAFEKYLGKEVIVPDNHDVTGAIGMALIAREHFKTGRESGVRSNAQDIASTIPDSGRHLTPVAPATRLRRDSLPLTSFKGFGLAKRQYEISSFECRACPNVCEINRVKIEGEAGNLYYGGRCEKYDIGRNRLRNELPDLFGFREEKLREEHLKYSEESGVRSKENNDKDTLQGVTVDWPDSKTDSSLLTPHTSRGTIGIPYIFYFHDYLPFWTTLLWELGFKVEVSPPTDRKTVDLGLENILAETCFPVKAANGHIMNLIERNVDSIFLPSFVDLNSPGHGSGKGFSCPYTQTVPYMSNIAFRGTSFLIPVLSFHRGENYLIKELKRVFRPFSVSTREIERAVSVAGLAQAGFLADTREKGQAVLSGLNRNTLVIVGRAYNAFDRGMNMNIPGKLADLGVLSIPMDFLPLDEAQINRDIGRDWPNMYWRAGQRILSAARIIRDTPLLYPVYIGNFSCGPDSFIIKFFEKELGGKPYLHLEIDAHSADAGAITRCEAFMDSISNFKGVRGKESRLRRVAGATADRSQKILKQPIAKNKTVFIPRMSDHAFALAAAFRHCGVDAEVLPEPTRESVDLGKKYVSGKECYPCAVTTGDMVKKINEPGFDPARASFFMPSGSGPCRFGQYNVFHRMVMNDIGYADVPVLSPVQNEAFYKHLGMIGKDFTIKSWEGIIAIELLTKCLHETRPYEKESGSSDGLYSEHLKRICRGLESSNGALKTGLRSARSDFEAVGRTKEQKALIGIVGEIFVRSNRFSNEDLVRLIESLGGEAYLAPVEEWFYYINHTGMQKVRIRKDWSSLARLTLKRYLQKRIEHRLAGLFKGFLRTLDEPDTSQLLRLAAPYLHESFEGEAILSIGKGIDLINRGAAGLVNAMPFGCMPGTIVSALMQGLRSDFGIPCLSIPFDGTESLTTRIQAEAFMDQALSIHKSRHA